MDDKVSTDHAMAPAKKHLWRTLGVREGEQARLIWSGALFFVVFASFSIGLNVADALFFLRFGVESLPWMIMISGLLVMAITVGYAAGMAGFGNVRWPWLIAAGFSVLVALEQVAVRADMPGVYPVVWLTNQVVMYVSLTMLWDVAGSLVDARQAKRLFPLLTSAGVAGAVTGNALTGPLAVRFGTDNLLLFEAVGLGLAAWLALRTTSQYSSSAGEDPNIIGDLRAGLDTTMRVPLFRLLAAVGAAMSILFFFVVFPFSEVVTASFRNEAELAGFLGLFSSVATAVTLLISLVVTNRLFARFGVVAVLVIVAIVYVAGFSLWLTSLGLVTAALFRGSQWIAVNALGGTAFSSVFNVLPGKSRSQVRDFVSAVPVQLGTVAGGALLLATREISVPTRTVLSLAMAIAFLLLVLPMRKAYGAALVEAVRLGMSDVFTATTPGMQKPHLDADSLSALTQGANDEQPGRRRVTAVILGELGGKAALGTLKHLLADPDEAVRVAAIDGLGNLDPADIGTVAVGLLGDPSHKVRVKAIGLIVRGPDPDQAVIDALEDENSEVRAHAARIVGGSRGRTVIMDLIATDEPPGLIAALRCVLAEPDLAPLDPEPLCGHRDATVRALAASLLAIQGHGAATLKRLLDDSSADVRLAAGRALTAVEVRSTHDALNHGSMRSREAALYSLVESPVEGSFLHAWAASQVDRAARLHTFRTAIATRTEGACEAAVYLIRVLKQRESILERWVLTALGNEETKTILALVARGAISGEADVKSDALEAIESLTDRPIARRLVALLEGSSGDAILNRVQALQHLAEDPDDWFRALAIRTLHDELNNDLQRAAAAAATDPSAVVRAAIRTQPPLPTIEPDHMSIVDAVLALQRAAILEHVDLEGITAIARLCNERKFDPGQLLWERDSPGDEMMVICSGSAVVISDTDDLPIAEIGPGEFLGELAVLRGSVRMAKVVAGSNGLTVLGIDATEFLDTLNEQPHITTALLTALAERVVHTVAHEGGDLRTR